MSIALPLYLAITAAEISRCSSLPQRPAYMACHFSSHSAGLSNLPETATDMLILDDSLPPCGHDPQVICKQLQHLCQQLNTNYLLLDFQRPDDPQTSDIVEKILENKPCYTIVSEHYAKKIDCPVFLTTPLPHQALDSFIAPWSNRDIWLELATETILYTVTETDCTVQPVSYEPAEKFCRELHCHYSWSVFEDHIDFTLSRDCQDCYSLLAEAKKLGVVGGIGLYQQFL